MSAIDRFKNAWSARFPSDPVPDLPCLRPGQLSGIAAGVLDTDGSPIYGTVYGNVDVSAVERSLQACNASIERLHREIEQQQFIADYLWNILHGVGVAEPVSDLSLPASRNTGISAPLIKHAKKKPAAQRFAESRSSSLPLEKQPSVTDEAAAYDEYLDNPVPIQDLHSPTEGNTLVDLTSPISSASSLVEPEFTSGSSKRVDECHPVAIRKHSMPLLDQTADNIKGDSDDERLNSLESKLSTSPAMSGGCTSPSAARSGSKTAHRQKPVPTPRFSMQKPATVGQVTVIQIDGIDGSVSSTDSSSSYEQNAAESGHPAVARVQSSPSPLPKTLPKVKLESSESNKRVGSVRDRVKALDTKGPSIDTTIGKDPSFSSKRQARARDDYEEAVPFSREAADSDEGGAVSSDDEEPLYYNMMLMKEQMLNRAHTFYAKASKPGGLNKTSEASAENPVQANPSGAQLLKAREAGKSMSRESSMKFFIAFFSHLLLMPV
jgi:hypothetical protein